MIADTSHLVSDLMEIGAALDGDGHHIASAAVYDASDELFRASWERAMLLATLEQRARATGAHMLDVEEYIAGIQARVTATKTFARMASEQGFEELVAVREAASAR